jgi:hypothetical protein
LGVSQLKVAGPDLFWAAAFDPKAVISNRSLNVANGCKADLVEPMVTGTSSGPFLIFAEHRPKMRSCFGNVPLTNHFEAELEV